MNTDTNRNQKKIKLKRFLEKLSEDPTLLNQDNVVESRSLSEYLILTGYRPKDGPIDMAELVSLLLKRIGLQADSEDLMESVMKGGSIDHFMNTWK
ncbi:hypothetical protein ACP8HI_02010 [Paenibacillus sp. FA6]|uniref:hypothetical protein n=1 Tax=Paenibacillus sp. FA6 TaxID=3413029 RepID=UPI003F658A4A